MSTSHLIVLILPILMRIAAFALIFAAVHRCFASARDRHPSLLNTQAGATSGSSCGNRALAKPHACERARASTDSEVGHINTEIGNRHMDVYRSVATGGRWHRR